MAIPVQEVVGVLDPFVLLSWSQLFGYAREDDNALMRAGHGIRWCGDERPVENAVLSGGLPPAVFGGAFGFYLKFRMFGKNRDDAWALTQKLYWMMNWTMMIHNDNHGAKEHGCGFLWNMGAVTEVLARMMPFLKLQPVKIQPVNEFQRAIMMGAQVITLDGDHKIDTAKFMLNLRPGFTINPGVTYTHQPTFTSDIWVIRDDKLLMLFNGLAGTKLTMEQWTQLHVMQEMAIGLLLGALKPDFSNFIYAIE